MSYFLTKTQTIDHKSNHKESVHIAVGVGTNFLQKHDYNSTVNYLCTHGLSPFLVYWHRSRSHNAFGIWKVPMKTKFLIGTAAVSSPHTPRSSVTP